MTTNVLHAEDIFGADATDDKLTEAAAAERFARRHGDDATFDHRRGRYLLWDGHRWRPDSDGAITRLALTFVRDWLRESMDITDRQKRDDVYRFVNRLERREALASLLQLARNLHPITDAGDQWDHDPMVLGVGNGAVDLRGCGFRAGARGDQITMRTGVEYDPDAQCPRFERFVLEISNGDAALAEYHRRIVGYMLTGDTSEQILLMWHGLGANGKSTFFKILLYVLGDYGDTAAFSTFERASVRGSIPNDLAALAGKRLIVASETREGARLDEGRLKSITGGDRLRARFLNQEWFSFDPTFKLVLCVNHRPVVSDDSFGFWRRVRLVPFLATFEPNSRLDDELRAEAPGILAWAVRGCLAWQRDGLVQPATVETATANYQAESDQLADFLDEACELDAASVITAAEFYTHYTAWADKHGLKERGERLTATGFGRKVAERFVRTKSRIGAVYQGVARRNV